MSATSGHIARSVESPTTIQHVIVLLIVATALLALVSVIALPGAPLWAQLLPLALGLVSFVSSSWGLVALSAIAPLGSVLLIVGRAPQMYYAEALVLATIAGALLGTLLRRSRPWPRDPIFGAAAVFAAVIVCSTAVCLGVTQAGLPLRWLFARDLLGFVTRDYLGPRSRDFAIVGDAALLLEGLALVWLVWRETVRRPDHATHLAIASTASATIAALASVWHAVRLSASAGSIGEFMRQVLTNRVVVHIADVNSAGSYFAMCGIIALGLALRGHGVRRLWLAVLALQGAALWITGSRAAIVFAFAAGVLLVGGVKRGDRTWRRLVMLVAAAFSTGLLVLALVSHNRLLSWSSVQDAVRVRAGFMVTTLRMMTRAPVFGIGIGRYYEASERFVPDWIRGLYVRENAHNNVLQVAGELGVVGVAAFLAFLALAATRIRRGVRFKPGDQVLASLALGLAAFVATWLTGHPLLVPEAAYPFWMLLGAALGLASEPAPAWAPVVVDRLRPLASYAIAAALLLSVPIRTRAEIRSLDLSDASFGFYFAEGSETGAPLRWTSRRAAFFVAPDRRAVTLSIRAIHILPNVPPTVVSIAVNGEVVASMTLASNDWARVAVPLTGGRRQPRYQRIDLVTNPVWSPSFILDSRADMRLLGVQLGQVDASLPDAGAPP